MEDAWSLFEERIVHGRRGKQTRYGTPKKLNKKKTCVGLFQWSVFEQKFKDAFHHSIKKSKDGQIKT